LRSALRTSQQELYNGTMQDACEIWAVVPVKRLSLAKQRLAGVLAPEVRQALACAMLEDVLAALAAARGLAGILVVTADSAAARIAARYGAEVSRDQAEAGHSAAVAGAAQRLAARGAAMLTVPADIPLIRAEDIARIIASLGAAPCFTIAPARDECGSNAVLCSPADAISLRFGENSYFPHLAAARAAGIEPVTLRLARVALDIDRPEDLAELARARMPSRARAVLERLGAAAALPDAIVQ